jgi:hypothetical protein
MMSCLDYERTGSKTMTKTLSGTASLSNSSSLALSLRAVWTLRLALGFTALLGSILFFLGTSWDIQWHTFLGRDRTLIPPHEMMLCGVALSGIAALVAVLIETFWLRRRPALAASDTDFAALFHGPLGAYITGFAALNAAVAFPLDAYWHSLYGIDVAIWAPFHVMFIMGMAIVALGAAYMLVSAAHLAARGGAVVAKRAAYVGVLVALATMLSNLALLLFDALDKPGFINLPFMTFNLFPALSGIVVGVILVAAAYAVPWRWAATSVAGVYLALAGIVGMFVPPALYWLLALERLSFRPDQQGDPHLALVMQNWPIAALIAAVLIDVFLRRAHQKGWSARKLSIVLTAIILLGSLPIPLFFPVFIAYLAYYTGIAGFIVTLLLGWLGALVGMWFGRNVGASMSSLER